MPVKTDNSTDPTTEAPTETQTVGAETAAPAPVETVTYVGHANASVSIDGASYTSGEDSKLVAPVSAAEALAPFGFFPA